MLSGFIQNLYLHRYLLTGKMVGYNVNVCSPTTDETKSNEVKIT